MVTKYVLILPERKTLNLGSNGDEVSVNFAREEDIEPGLQR